MDNITIQQLRKVDSDSVRMVGTSLAFLRDDYPGFGHWYNQTVVPSIGDNRMVFFASPQGDCNRLAGAMILKKTFYEKKICTLYIPDDFRGRGIGTAFMKKAIITLGDRHPVITVSEPRVTEFDSFLQRFGFKLYDSYSGYYRSGFHELSYNGPIEPLKCSPQKVIYYFMPGFISQVPSVTCC